MTLNYEMVAYYASINRCVILNSEQAANLDEEDKAFIESLEKRYEADRKQARAFNKWLIDLFDEVEAEKLQRKFNEQPFSD